MSDSDAVIIEEYIRKEAALRQQGQDEGGNSRHGIGMQKRERNVKISTPSVESSTI